MKKRTVEISNPQIEEKNTRFFKKTKSNLAMAADTINTALRTDLATRQQPAVGRVIAVIELLKGTELLQLLKKMNYSVFDWAVQHNNIALLEALFKNLESYNHFLMLEHDDYKPLRQFIREIISLPFEEYQKRATLNNEVLIQLVKLGVESDLMDMLIKDTKKQLPSLDDNTLSIFQQALVTALQKKPDDSSIAKI
ncbi:MAG: hypothetical protein K2Q33_08345 [Gammaproteobacteria bacterium]|nr:hypothetical protein [Gammaproteobacteria bacterium]